MQENLPYPPQKNIMVNCVPDHTINAGYADLPYKQPTPCISTSCYRFMLSEDGDSVFMNTHQPDNREKDFFGIKEE